MERIYIGLGANIEPRALYLERAVKKMEEKIEILKVSSIYETEPVGYKNQDRFLNAVLVGKTSLSPKELLFFLQTIEEELNRRREIRWGPRTIDLDVLFYGERAIKEKDLEIPHPRIGERAFVLIPLEEIEEGPIMGRTPRERLAECPIKEGAVVKFGQLFQKKG